MIRKPTTLIRAALAFAAGVAFDAMVFLDAYPYNQRYQHASPGLSLMLALPLAAAFVLDLGVRLSRTASGAGPLSGSLFARLDTRGPLIPLAMLFGMTAAHLVAVIHDTMIDATTHNLLQLEFVYAWIVVGVPAVIGSMLARGICRVLPCMQAAEGAQPWDRGLLPPSR
jgi:hypothetical protein